MSKKKIIVLSVIIVAVITAITAVILVFGEIGGTFRSQKSVCFEVEEGTPAVTVANTLKRSGAIKSALLFRVYAKLTDVEGKFSYGSYEFSANLSYKEIANELINNGEKAKTVSVTIPEMSTVDDIALLLSDANVCTKEDFYGEIQNGSFDFDFIKDIPVNKVHYRFEGYLFPNTYSFFCYDSKICSHLAVEKMLKATEDNLNELKKEISKNKYSIHEIMTMASVIELEAGGNPEEMANVSAVFYNRLKSPNFPTLGSSPTIKYPYGNGAYNTYECLGLPAGPLCQPSLASIKAAISPTENFDYYYFVTDKSMNFYYKKTLAEHNAIISKLQKENNWIYE